MGNVTFDEKSCGVIAFREKDGERLYLVLKYPGGHFDFPKGHVEDGEKEHETALRELLEETGISDLEIIDGFREEISYRYNKKGKPSHKHVIFFLGKTNLENIKISHEHLDSYWLPYDAAYNKATFDNAKNLLKKTKKFLEE
ncbi:NUDIX domain-containing protein [Candidatus Peregrinibacteria bacterium]|nr:NUDIX domain-containing protein [Candidatus Peregrinibacteria bacterium]